jgi:hypothetical protein
VAPLLTYAGGQNIVIALTFLFANGGAYKVYAGEAR